MLVRSTVALTTCSILLGLSGCAGVRPFAFGATSPKHSEATPAEESSYSTVASNAKLEPPHKAHFATPPRTAVRPPQTAHRQPIAATMQATQTVRRSSVRTVSHEPATLPSVPATRNATLRLNGRTYQVQLVDNSLQTAAAPGTRSNDGVVAPPSLPTPVAEEELFLSELEANALPLNLPTALSMIGGQHPAVGFAQWRVQEAYANLDRAKVLWLPSIRTGLSMHRHDGNYQASDGSIVDVNRNSVQYGLGAGATGAGTTPLPGVVANFHLADAIFQPKIAKKTAWAQGHAANGVINDQLRTVAIAYLDWIEAQQELRIIEEAQARTHGLVKLTADFAAAGEGLQADADRLRTESILIDGRLAEGRERIEVSGARLKQSISIDANQFIAPIDPTVVPIDLVSLEQNKSGLVASGLSNRPELKEAQALVAVACERFKHQKYSPFVPSVLLGYSTGAFGGGLGSNTANVGGRYDFDAIVTWEVRNLGLGERSGRRAASAQVQQAKYEKIRVMDQVAREVTEAYAQAIHRSDRVLVTQAAIQSARDSYERNLSRIRDGQGLPLEALQSVQAMEVAQRAYLSAVIDYNQSQFQLQWALGWPVSMNTL